MSSTPRGTPPRKKQKNVPDLRNNKKSLLEAANLAARFGDFTGSFALYLMCIAFGIDVDLARLFNAAKMDIDVLVKDFGIANKKRLASWLDFVKDVYQKHKLILPGGYRTISLTKLEQLYREEFTAERADKAGETNYRARHAYKLRLIDALWKNHGKKIKELEDHFSRKVQKDRKMKMNFFKEAEADSLAESNDENSPFIINSPPKRYKRQKDPSVKKLFC